MGLWSEVLVVMKEHSLQEAEFFCKSFALQFADSIASEISVALLSVKLGSASSRHCIWLFSIPQTNLSRSMSFKTPPNSQYLVR